MSCAQSVSDVSKTVENSSQNLIPGENRYEMIARLHNEGLGYVFDHYFGNPATKASSGISAENFMDRVIADGIVDEFMESKGYTVENGPITKAQVQQDVQSFHALAEERNCPYYDELESLLTNSDGLNDFQDAVKAFIEKVSCDESLDAIDKESLLAGAYTLSASAEYWCENLDQWLAALSPNEDYLVPETKGRSFALRVEDSRGRGIGQASVFAGEDFATMTNSDGYVVNYSFGIGELISVFHDGYRSAEGIGYTGTNMVIQLESDNSWIWPYIGQIVLADGAGAAEVLALDPAIIPMLISGGLTMPALLGIVGGAAVDSLIAVANYVNGHPVEN